MQSSVVVQRSESQNQLSNYDLYLILDCSLNVSSDRSNSMEFLSGWVSSFIRCAMLRGHELK